MINNGNKFKIWWANGTKSGVCTLLGKDFDWKLWRCESEETATEFLLNPLSSSIASIEKLED